MRRPPPAGRRRAGRRHRRGPVAAAARLRPRPPGRRRAGLRALPNVNPVTEMVDLISASRSYEANVTAMQTAKTDVHARRSELLSDAAADRSRPPALGAEWQIAGDRRAPTAAAGRRRGARRRRRLRQRCSPSRSATSPSCRTTPRAPPSRSPTAPPPTPRRSSRPSSRPSSRCSSPRQIRTKGVEADQRHLPHADLDARRPEPASCRFAPCSPTSRRAAASCSPPSRSASSSSCSC